MCGLCDDQAIVVVLHSRARKHLQIMYMLRCLFCNQSNKCFQIVGVHTQPGQPPRWWPVTYLPSSLRYQPPRLSWSWSQQSRRSHQLVFLLEASVDWTLSWMHRFKAVFAMVLPHLCTGFCGQFNIIDPFLVNEKILCFFALKLVDDGLSPQTREPYCHL